MKTVDDFQRIVDYVNSFGMSDGVHCTLTPLDGYERIKYRKLYDIELTYKNYHHIERFNSEMNFGDYAEARIAVTLLRNLFGDYFEAIKEIKIKGEG